MRVRAALRCKNIRAQSANGAPLFTSALVRSEVCVRRVRCAGMTSQRRRYGARYLYAR